MAPRNSCSVAPVCPRVSYRGWAARNSLLSSPTRRSSDLNGARNFARLHPERAHYTPRDVKRLGSFRRYDGTRRAADRKSTRLNSSHVSNSYAVFCWKKKKISVEADAFEEEAGRGQVQPQR